MKKNALIPILLWVNLCVMMVACSDDDYVQPDSLPEWFQIEIINANGDNLLDPDTESNLWEKGNVTIIWNDEEYELNAETKSGVVSVKTPDFGNGPHYVLEFFYILGEIVLPTEIVMVWGDGTQNTIICDPDDLEFREIINHKDGDLASCSVLTLVLADNYTNSELNEY